MTYTIPHVTVYLVNITKCQVLDEFSISCKIKRPLSFTHNNFTHDASDSLTWYWWWARHNKFVCDTVGVFYRQYVLQSGWAAFTINNCIGLQFECNFNQLINLFNVIQYTLNLTCEIVPTCCIIKKSKDVRISNIN